MQLLERNAVNVFLRSIVPEGRSLTSDVGYLQVVMKSQTTLFLLVALCSLCATASVVHARVSGAPSDTVLGRLGHVYSASTIQGTFSLEGTMTIGNLPFVARFRNDTIVVTLAAPFGMTAGTLYVTADTFVVVNYLSREVLVGHPDAETIAASSPIPLKVGDVRAFLRGTVPGDLSRFRRGARRSDSKVLFVARDTSSTEFVLVDTATSTLSQYQRKNQKGSTLLNLVLGDLRIVDSLPIAHAIDVDLEDKTQAVRFRFESVDPVADTSAMRMPEVPSSFTRRVFSR